MRQCFVHTFNRDRVCRDCGMPKWVWMLTDHGRKPHNLRDLVERRPEEFPEVPMQYDTIHGWRVR